MSQFLQFDAAETLGLQKSVAKWICSFALHSFAILSCNNALFTNYEIRWDDLLSTFHFEPSDDKNASFLENWLVFFIKMRILFSGDNYFTVCIFLFKSTSDRDESSFSVTVAVKEEAKVIEKLKAHISMNELNEENRIQG